MNIFKIRPSIIIFIIIVSLIINNVIRYYTSLNIYELFNMIMIRIVYFDILQLKSLLILPNVTFSYFNNKDIEIGNYIFINRMTHICATVNSKIVIKDNCLIGPNVTIIAATHDTTSDFKKRCHVIPNNIIIEKNVWIGTGAIIIGDITIGENSIIGAGSVVTKSIPKNCIAVGVPAKVKRFLNN